jgi:hypothetical protein
MKPESIEVTREPLTGVQIRIGVMGSAGGAAEPAVSTLCRRLGQAVAKRACCLLTGACPGLPHEAALGAQRRSVIQPTRWRRALNLRRRLRGT